MRINAERKSIPLKQKKKNLQAWFYLRNVQLRRIFPQKKTLNFSTILPNLVNHAHSLMSIKYKAF